jgi:gluconokinase
MLSYFSHFRFKGLNFPRAMSTISPQRAESPFILSIDIGTSSVRAALFDRLGRAVNGMESRQVHEIGATPEGAAEADPDGLLEGVFGCLDRLLGLAGRLPIRIEGVAACTLVNNILGVDEDNRAITPLTTYADTRAEGEVARLKSDFDETVVHDRTGCRFHPSYLPARFGWLARKKSDLFAKVARWVSLGEYLELKLFGKTAVSYSVASWTGLLDRFQLVWDSQLLAALPVKREMLSPLTDVSRSRRGLRFGFAERWPSLAEVPWFPAVGDGAAANIGSGCISSRQVALTMGTSSALRVVLNTPVPHLPAGLWCYRVDGPRSLLGGALTEGGSTYAWMKTALNLTGHPSLEEALAGMEPDSHGLTILPFLAGERAPGWAGHARATVHGLSLATAPLDILRAGMEAVAYRLALVFELLRPMIAGDPRIVASGGALLRSPAWLQIVTDVLGRPVGVSGVEEASGRGAALLALEALGQIGSLEEVPNFIVSVHHPDPGRHGRYGEAMERQKRLYRKLVETAD